VSDITTAYPDEIRLFIFENKWEQSVIEILSTKLEEPILSDREKMILDTIQNGGQATVENARHKFSSKETSVCPYCYQVVSETYKQGLIDSIDKVLNKEVDAHKAALKAISIPNLSIDLTSYEELDPKLFKSIVAQLNECQTVIESYKTAIETKLNNVYTPVQLSGQDLSAAITHLNELLKKLEDKRKEFNIAASKKGTLVKELTLTNGWRDISTTSSGRPTTSTSGISTGASANSSRPSTSPSRICREMRSTSFTPTFVTQG